MNPFDDRFADRAREVFDAYAEPVDEPTWERVQTALEQDRIAARDRAPVAGVWARRSRAVVALATLVLVGGVGTWVWQVQSEDPVTETAVVHADAAPSTPVRPAPLASPAREGTMTEHDAGGPAQASPQPSAPSATAPTETRVLLAQAPSGAAPRRASPARSRALAPPLNLEAEASAGAPSPPSQTVQRPAPEPLPAAEAPPAYAELAESASPLAPASGSPILTADAAGASRAVADAVTRVQGPDERDEMVARESTPAPSRLGVDLVLATNAAFSGRQLAEGAGLTAGLSREWRVGNGLAISTGAQAAYTRLATDPDASAAEALTSLESDPSQPVEIPSQTTLSTLALEVPLDIIVDVARAGSGRIRAGAGLTTSLYLSQQFEDEGTRFALDQDVTSSGEGVQITTTAYSGTETSGPLSRLDLGRQANVSIGYTLDGGRTPLSVDAYTRLPLGGITSRDLPLTVVGLRLRLGL